MDLSSESVLRGRRLLLVEDEDSTRRLLASVLVEHGAEVREASSGQQALEMLSEGGFDLVVTDVVMPVPLGTQVATMARVAGEAVPILVITAHRNEDVRRVVSRLPDARLLFKPFDVGTFLATVREMLRPRASPPNASR